MNNDYLPAAKESLEENDASFLLLQIFNLWKGNHSKALKKHYNLTHIQYLALLGIYRITLHDKKPVSQIMLANHAKIDPMTLSHIIKGLEIRGYVSRITHPGDIRAKAIDLTPKGKEVIVQAIITIKEVDRKFFKVLGKDSNRFDECLKSLLNPNI